MGFRTVGIVAVAALAAAPVLAEKAFIPAADGATQRTEISLANAKGARAAAVLAKIAYEAGGASAQQKVTLGGGQSLRLSGLAGNGLVELDLAKSVKATATLVVERPGGKTVRASLPVLNTADHMPAGTDASLEIVSLPEEYRKVSVGAVNLSSRAMRCEARFHDSDGIQLAPSVAFTVAPYAERRAGSFAGGKGRYDVDALNTLRCDQPFWAYALAEHPTSGDVRVVYPMKEVALASAATVTTQASTVYSIPGQFFVASSAKWSYKYSLSFTSRTLRQIFVDFDVFVARWDPQKPSGTHLVLWLQKDTWSTMLQYFNVVKSGYNKFRWNYKPSGSVGNSAPGLKVGYTYHVRTWWDGVNKKNGFRADKAGVLHDTAQGSLGVSSITTSKLFLVFAHGNNGADGPESRSPGWKWSNLKVELIN